MNWDEEDLEWLQDPTMGEDAEKGYEEYMSQWESLYKCLKNYPDLFDSESIGMNKFKYVYILTTNRCFSSNFPGVSQMVPFADFLNHENVDTCFDCVDSEGKTIGEPTDEESKLKEEAEEEIRKDNAEKRDFISTMKTDLLELETKLRKMMEENGSST